MTRNKDLEKDQNPPPKSTKPKGSVNLGRSNFIEKILGKVESQAAVGFQTVSRKIPIVIP